MKRLLLFIAILTATATLQAADLNIYASGLTVMQENGGEAQIGYTLNAPATSLAVILEKSDASPIEIEITGSANLTKGAHTGVAVSLSGIPNGTYKWSMKATGEATTAVKVTGSSIYSPLDVAVDNSFDSPYFGRIYMANGIAGTSSYCPYGNRATLQGIYIYDADLSGGTTCYTGGVSWTSAYDYVSPRRLAVSEDGKVFIGDFSDGNSGVWVMNPTSPSTAFTSVWNNSSRTNGWVPGVHGTCLGLVATGSGANTKLYTVDEYLVAANNTTKGTKGGKTNIQSGNIFRYDVDVPNLAITPASTPAATVYDNSNEKIHNAMLSLASDGYGGWWIGQWNNTHSSYAASGKDDAPAYTNTAAKPALLHITANGICDWTSENLSFTNTQRGAMAVNPKGNLLAIMDNGYVKFFSVEFNGDNLTSVAASSISSIQISTGYNQDGLAFDVADNIYIASWNSETVFACSTTKSTATNSFTTPAPSSQSIEVKHLEIAAHSEATWETYTTGNYVNIILNEGSQLTGVPQNAQVNGVVKYQRTFAEKKWYAVGFPFAIDKVSCNVDGGINWDKDNLKAAASDNDLNGDYWLKTYDDAQDKFVYTAGGQGLAAGGYILAVPSPFDNKELTFTSAQGITLPANNADFSVTTGGYKLTNNPSMENKTLTPGDVTADNNYYCLGAWKETAGDDAAYYANNFGLITSSRPSDASETANIPASYDLKPFESLVVARSIPSGVLRSFMGVEKIEVITGLDTPKLDGEPVAVRYYNLQGVEIFAPAEGQIYIAKEVYKSGKVSVKKMVK